MFLIFGVGDKKAEEFQVAKTEHCFHCNNARQWTATKVTEHISLFFLPVFPYKSTYWYTCPICNQGRKITKEEFERMKF